MMETIYWTAAIAGTAVFVLKLAMMFMGFGDDDLGDGGDVSMATDFDGDGVVGHGAESTMMFRFLSLQSLATFFMGAGWMGLVALRTWSLDDIAAALSAAGFGALCVVLLGKLFLYVPMRAGKSEVPPINCRRYVCACSYVLLCAHVRT